MSSALHLATGTDFKALEGLVVAFHAEMHITTDTAHRHAALMPLLEGSPYGAAYLIGPRRAPVGYIVVTFTWSVEFGGMEATLDEVYIRPNVRGKGMASQALILLCQTLEKNGIMGISLEVDKDDLATQKLYTRMGFLIRERFALMTRKA
ncbi:hypothetical protein NBRC116594_01700 [Shimia sp. NS0008-38b]|uniref:GNAT family N-acetyltransferase n=1 Tax=Shimia sp. NS0008-38b TaxID=3127653 RepID=UPI00310AC2B9